MSVYNPTLDDLVSDKEISAKVYNVLHAARIKTLADIAEFTRDELLEFRNIGETNILEIEEALNKHGLKVRETEEMINQRIRTRFTMFWSTGYWQRYLLVKYRFNVPVNYWQTSKFYDADHETITLREVSGSSGSGETKGEITKVIDVSKAPYEEVFCDNLHELEDDICKKIHNAKVKYQMTHL